MVSQIMGYNRNPIRRFTVYGKIHGKARPRARKMGRFLSVYDPEDNLTWRHRIVEAYIHDCGNPKPFDGETPLDLYIAAYFAIPKAFSKKKRELAIIQAIRPIKKPDFDNIAKIVADALGDGVAYPDDKQITDAEQIKLYSEGEEYMIVTLAEAVVGTQLEQLAKEAE